MIPEDLSRFIREEEWFFTPDNQSIRTAVGQWYAGKRLKENGHIGAWNTSNVTKMSYLFNCRFKFNDDIGAWNVSNVTDMHCMFFNAESFNQSIALWDVSNVTNMASMFRYAISFDQPLETWNVSKVTNHGAKNFNRPLGL